MHEILHTEDLILQQSNTILAKKVAEYYFRNKDFLEEFEPQRENEFFKEEYQFNILKQEMEQIAENESFRFYIIAKKEPDKIIGVIGLNNVVWGCFCSCFLGYKLDFQTLCRGYMTQAVSAISKMAFEDLKLHRIEANVMPKNKPSLRVLEKCGFKNEGISEKYLKINGVWEDHIHMVKLAEHL